MTARARAMALTGLVCAVGSGRLLMQRSDLPVVAGRWSWSLFGSSVALGGCAVLLLFVAVRLRRWPSPPISHGGRVMLVLLVTLAALVAATSGGRRSQDAIDVVRVVGVTVLVLGWLAACRPGVLTWYPSRRHVARLALATTAMSACVLVVELGARQMGLESPRGSPVVRYRPHPYLVYVPAEETFAPALARFWEGSTIDQKPIGSIRVVCFGGSTTEEGWPTDLEAALDERLGREVEVLNAGVASYTSAENLAALLFRGTDSGADIVVLEHGVNDVRPRVYPGYRRDFAHYRHPWRLSWAERARGVVERASTWSHAARFIAQRVAPFQSLEHVTTIAHGHGEDRRPAALDPATTIGFERNTVAFVRLARAYGASVVLVTEPFDDSDPWRVSAPRYVAGIPEHNGLLVAVASREGAVLADAATALGGRPELFIDIVHTTAEGRQLKARVVADAIVSAGLLDAASGDGAEGIGE